MIWVLITVVIALESILPVYVAYRKERNEQDHVQALLYASTWIGDSHWPIYQNPVP